ncbi:leucine-rich repeat protein [Tanacetum coccineum]
MEPFLSFCDWSGISCGKRHKRVIALRLGSQGLEGSLCPHVGNFSFLRELYLTNNSFQGTIPHEFGRLSRLRRLYLNRNKFSGVIPTNLCGCSNLEDLWLDRNKLVGSIPKEMSNLCIVLRDIRPLISDMSGQSLGAWIVSYTSLFLQDLYMKYLGRTLNGKMVESDGVGGWLGFKVFVVDGYVDGGGGSWQVVAVVAGYWWWSRFLSVSDMEENCYSIIHEARTALTGLEVQKGSLSTICMINVWKNRWEKLKRECNQDDFSVLFEGRMRTLEVSCLLMLTWKIFVSLNNPLPLMSGFRSGGFSRVTCDIVATCKQLYIDENTMPHALMCVSEKCLLQADSNPNAKQSQISLYYYKKVPTPSSA